MGIMGEMSKAWLELGLKECGRRKKDIETLFISFSIPGARQMNQVPHLMIMSSKNALPIWILNVGICKMFHFNTQVFNILNQVVLKMILSLVPSFTLNFFPCYKM